MFQPSYLWINQAYRLLFHSRVFDKVYFSFVKKCEWFRTLLIVLIWSELSSNINIEDRGTRLAWLRQKAQQPECSALKLQHLKSAGAFCYHSSRTPRTTRTTKRSGWKSQRKTSVFGGFRSFLEGCSGVPGFRKKFPCAVQAESCACLSAEAQRVLQSDVSIICP